VPNTCRQVVKIDAASNETFLFGHFNHEARIHYKMGRSGWISFAMTTVLGQFGRSDIRLYLIDRAKVYQPVMVELKEHCQCDQARFEQLGRDGNVFQMVLFYRLTAANGTTWVSHKFQLHPKKNLYNNENMFEVGMEIKNWSEFMTHPLKYRTIPVWTYGGVKPTADSHLLYFLSENSGQIGLLFLGMTQTQFSYQTYFVKVMSKTRRLVVLFNATRREYRHGASKSKPMNSNKEKRAPSA